MSIETAGGVAGWKLIGGLAGAGAIGAGLAAIVVMCLTKPRSTEEWIVGLISTVVGSIAGGAAVVQHFGLQAWADTPTGLVAMLGLVFSCGLPAWAVVRWLFNYINKRGNATIDEIAREIKQEIV
ncbi:hypothetical protein [Pseudoduganella chitinolytica]|uniref:Holin n=1 Tax=Pseudoduganella chitinolytica TaxID=34070 RepID=A0ABY8BIV6_9BURK|nr:hypothetical protein [Pseudoduganella chitinolytica]WEF34851.1 hypothetical protein PX653_08845 [Pseudoduganella chitinolytica]